MYFLFILPPKSVAENLQCWRVCAVGKEMISLSMQGEKERIGKKKKLILC